MDFKHEYPATNFYEVYGWIFENGVKKIGYVHINGKSYGSDLEKIVESSGSLIPKEKPLYDRKQDINDFLRKTNDDRTVMVDGLGKGILGMYDASTDMVYVVKGLDASTTKWVKEHEYAHRLMNYLGIKQSEALADWIATQRTGHDPFKGRLTNDNTYRKIIRDIREYHKSPKIKKFYPHPIVSYRKLEGIISNYIRGY